MKNLAKLFLPLFLLAFTFTACLDEDFDNPPTTGSDPNLTVTTTIAELKAMHSFGDITEINDDLVIKGIVVADDFSGNWYRSFVIQDETAGITVLVDITESYIYYPIGREVYIKLNGLAMSDYNNLIQLGVHNRVTGELDDILNVSDHLEKSVKKDPPAPKVLSINDLSIDDVGTLIKLEDVYFVDTVTTFADAAGQNTLNADLVDCNGNTVIVRTSGFASFASTSVPNGGGSFVGILSIFRNDFQLLVRDPSDLDMEGSRCGQGGGSSPCDAAPTAALDEDFENGSDGAVVSITNWTNVAVKGTRSWQYKEFDSNIYVQATAFNDNSPEMETWLVSPLIKLEAPAKLTFESATAFWTHNGLSVWISTDYNCDVTAATWQPLTATLAGSGSANYAFIPSGDIDLGALVGQTFVIGFKYVGSNGAGQTASYIIDNVKLGEGGGGPDPTDPCIGVTPVIVGDVLEDFQSGSNNAAVALNGWTNVATQGTRTWQFKEFDGNVYCQATAFNDTAPGMETWLVTPLIDVDGPKVLTFESAKAFWTHDGMTVWISTDFVCDPTDATWQPLNATLAGQSDTDHEFIPSGDVDLIDYVGQKVAIGFKYVGNNGAAQTSSYRIDNVVVE